MKDLRDDLPPCETAPAPQRSPAPPAAAALAARQAGGSTTPDTAAFLASFVKIAPLTTPAAPLFAPEEEAEIVADLIAEMRPMFQRDGGDIEMLSISGTVVRVRLSGSCAGCLMSARTLATVQQQVSETLGRPVRVLPEVRH